MNSHLRKLRELSFGSPSRKGVMRVLCDHADADGISFLLIATITKETELSERAVQMALRWLEVEGFLEVDRRKGRSSVFRVTICDPVGYVSPWSTPDTNVHSPPQPLHPPVQPLHPTPATNAPTPAVVAPISPSKPHEKPQEGKGKNLWLTPQGQAEGGEKEKEKPKPHPEEVPPSPVALAPSPQVSPENRAILVAKWSEAMAYLKKHEDCPGYYGVKEPWPTTYDKAFAGIVIDDLAGWLKDQKKNLALHHMAMS